MEGREITYSDFAVWEGPDLTSLPATPTAAGHDAAARFADALEGRAAASTMKGPWWDTLVRRPGSPTLWKVQIAPEDFSGTITFVNPTELTETPWDKGFAFHPVDNALQNVFVDSDGFWYYQGTRAGWASTFDDTPGVTNTLDLIVEGDTALFGVNGEFVVSIDVPTPTTFRIGVDTGLVPDYRVEGREIGFTFGVWI